MIDDQSYVSDHYEEEDRARAAHREKIVLACSKLFWLKNYFGWKTFLVSLTLLSSWLTETLNVSINIKFENIKSFIPDQQGGQYLQIPNCHNCPNTWYCG